MENIYYSIDFCWLFLLDYSLENSPRQNFPWCRIVGSYMFCIPAQVVPLLRNSAITPSLLNINLMFFTFFKAIGRYYIQPGHRPFGWIPPKKEYEYEVPLSLMIGGFIYVPGEAHLSPRRFMRDLRSLPIVDGQFNDCDVSINTFVLVFWFLYVLFLLLLLKLCKENT